MCMCMLVLVVSVSGAAGGVKTIPHYVSRMTKLPEAGQDHHPRSSPEIPPAYWFLGKKRRKDDHEPRFEISSSSFHA
jgi:hypothetical protein